MTMYPVCVCVYIVFDLCVRQCIQSVSVYSVFCGAGHQRAYMNTRRTDDSGSAADGSKCSCDVNMSLRTYRAVCFVVGF